MDDTHTSARRRRTPRPARPRRQAFRARFYLVTLLTIFVVAYVVVPFTANVLSSLGDYQPRYYDPKDVARVEYRAEGDRAARAPVPIVDAMLSSEGALGLGLVVLVAFMWLTVVPSSEWRDGPRD
jgi:hypothetical protein